MTLRTICFFALAAIGLPHPSSQGDVLTFEPLPVAGGGFYNGDISEGTPLRDNYSIVGTGTNYGQTEFLQRWTTGGFEFNNNYTPEFGSWSGWSWSNVENSTTAGFTNQFAAFPGGGADGLGGVELGGKYAVAFGQDAFFNVPLNATLDSLDLANTTYGALAMQAGDGFSKKFGGDSGNDPDFFRVTLSAFDAVGGATGLGSIVSAITVSLADYTFVDNTQDYILNDWTNIDLTSLSGARSVGLTFESSDSSVFSGTTYINTPLYVAVDNLSFTTATVPEPSSFAMLGLLALGAATCQFRRRKPAASA